MFKKMIITALAMGFMAMGAFSATASDTIKIGFNAPLTGFAASGRKILHRRRETGNKPDQCRRRRTGETARTYHLRRPGPNRPKPSPLPTNSSDGTRSWWVSVDLIPVPPRSAAGVFQENKIPYISAYGIHPDITRAGDYVFRHQLSWRNPGQSRCKTAGRHDGLKRKW